MAGLADILFAQLGLDKEEIMSLAHDAAHVVKSVDARLARMEENQRIIMASLNLTPVEPQAIEKGQIEDGAGNGNTGQ